MKAYIVEDEPHAQAALKQLVQLIAPDIQVTGIASNVSDGLQLIQREPPDLLFLDVKLGKETGFDLLRHFPEPSFSILFITAYNEFAIEAFQWNAAHYITKPIESQELKKGIEKVRLQQALFKPEQLESLLQQVQTQQDPNHIILRYDSIVERQPLDSIIRLQSDGGITYFYCVETDFSTQGRTIKRKAVSTNLGQYERMLPIHFFRCHQSHMVHRRYVRYYDRSENIIFLHTNEKIPVSRRGKDGLEEWMAEEL